MTKEEYIQKIIEILRECDDLDLLDLVLRITGKSVATD